MPGCPLVISKLKRTQHDGASWRGGGGGAKRYSGCCELTLRLLISLNISKGSSQRVESRERERTVMYNKRANGKLVVCAGGAPQPRPVLTSVHL